VPTLRAMRMDPRAVWAPAVTVDAPAGVEDPFIYDGPKVLARIVPPRSGELVRYYIYPTKDSHPFHGESRRIALLRGAPFDILQPAGWSVVAIVEADGSRWCLPFVEVKP